ncbi:MAG: hypothetical protein HKN23_18985, partial [Verrucomicrobiales bacterium]|nr:hypothetical protein [Verrucomicrobiales bacterium]
EEWYSTLNQARLLLNEVHDLAEDDNRFLMMLQEKTDGIDGARAMLLTQFEFYAIIQSILVDRVMS